MSECRRKSSTHSSTESLSQAKDHRLTPQGFANKLLADIKRICVYEPNSVKWMNEKPKNRKAYEPTEVIIDFLIFRQAFCCYITENGLKKVFSCVCAGRAGQCHAKIRRRADLFPTPLFLDWTHCQHYHAWLLDRPRRNRRLAVVPEISDFRPNDGLLYLRLGLDPAVLRQHRLPLRFLLQQRPCVEGCAAPNGPGNDLYFHRGLVFPLAESWPHVPSLHHLQPQVVDLGARRARNNLSTGETDFAPGSQSSRTNCFVLDFPREVQKPRDCFLLANLRWTGFSGCSVRAWIYRNAGAQDRRSALPGRRIFLQGWRNLSDGALGLAHFCGAGSQRPLLRRAQTPLLGAVRARPPQLNRWYLECFSDIARISDWRSQPRILKF